MKKVTAIMLSVVLVLALSGCGGIEDIVNSTLSSVTEGINNEITNTMNELSEAASSIVSNEINDGINEAVENVENELVQEPVDSLISATVGHDPSYWCELYGQNRCPFYISCLGIEEKYYFKNGGEFPFWVYTEENTGGWYLYNDHIISADNAFAIDISDGVDSFSSSCTYEAVPYVGESLTKEQQKEQLNGVFYVLNSYSPIRTNWGIQFFSNSDRNPDANLPEFTAYGLTDSLYEEEMFNMYISWYPSAYENAEAVDLWVFEHRDKSEYPELLSTDNYADQGINLGCIDFNEDEDCALIKTFIPSGEGGIDADRVDLVITYGNDLLTVGLVSVDIIAENASTPDYVYIGRWTNADADVCYVFQEDGTWFMETYSTGEYCSQGTFNYCDGYIELVDEENTRILTNMTYENGSLVDDYGYSYEFE